MYVDSEGEGEKKENLVFICTFFKFWQSYLYLLVLSFFAKRIAKFVLIEHMNKCPVKKRCHFGHFCFEFSVSSYLVSYERMFQNCTKGLSSLL